MLLEGARQIVLFHKNVVPCHTKKMLMYGTGGIKRKMGGSEFFVFGYFKKGVLVLKRATTKGGPKGCK